MTFAELKAELFDRGTNYLEESASGVARAERWLNDGYREILRAEAWPFLESTATGFGKTAPISDLRLVKFVRLGGGGAVLSFSTVEELVSEDGANPMTDSNSSGDTGTPYYYYITMAAGSTLGDPGDTANYAKIWGYPFDSGQSIEVTYLKRVDKMSDDLDIPIFDEEHHNLIVDKAMVRAYEDSDNFVAASALRASIEESLDSMTEDYQITQMGPRYIRYVSPDDC